MYLFLKNKENCLIFLGHQNEGGVKVAGTLSAIGKKLGKKRTIKTGVCRIHF